MSCGCEEVCNCAVVGTDCVSVVGDGSATSPYEVGIIIDPDPENAIECRPNGLFAFSGLLTADTDCISLTGTGLAGDPLEAVFVLSPDDDNRLECRPNGLYAYPCPEIFCCCAVLDGAPPPIPVLGPSIVTDFPEVCQIEVPEGSWRVSLEIQARFQWDAMQAGAPIDMALQFAADYCDPLTVQLNCPPTFRTSMLTAGAVSFTEVDAMMLDTAFDVVNPGPGSLTINITPQLATGTLHTAVVEWTICTTVAIVGRIAASQPVSNCVECV